MRQWLHCVLVQEYYMARKPVCLNSDLTNYDMKQQIKPRNDMEEGEEKNNQPTKKTDQKTPTNNVEKSRSESYR